MKSKVEVIVILFLTHFVILYIWIDQEANVIFPNITIYHAHFYIFGSVLKDGKEGNVDSKYHIEAPALILLLPAFYSSDPLT